ncbi:MAG: sulfatase-like hydrolase/transferase [Planctomycetota bacterium]|jgi:arylsulfatase A-like enzyme
MPITARLGCVVLACLFACTINASDKPNILLIVSDDQGYGDASCNWNTDLQTPVMDAIAAAGVRFTKFRVNPLCAPTRASYMTGLYSLEAGMWRGPGAKSQRDDPPPGGWGPTVRRIKDGVKMLPQYLKEAGYDTGMFGKWHLGYDRKNVPLARGFDTYTGFLSGAHPYWVSKNSKMLRDGQPFNDYEHATDLFADHAIEFIKANRDKPFFCYVPFNAVHGPLRNATTDRDSAKPEWLEHYHKLGVEQPRRDYNAVMTHADARVGDILKTLDRLGIAGNTLVIYLSDNGGIIDKFPSNNGPLRGGKGQAYEGGIRVPAVMRWPGVIPAGTVSDANAMHFDLFATILEAAGAQTPARNGEYKVSGVSLLDHLRSGAKKPLPDRYLFWELYGKSGALHGDWKLVAELPNHNGKFDAAVQAAREGDFELYNLGVDLGEKNNLAKKRPEIYNGLKSRFVMWMEAATR